MYNSLRIMHTKNKAFLFYYLRIYAFTHFFHKTINLKYNPYDTINPND